MDKDNKIKGEKRESRIKKNLVGYKELSKKGKLGKELKFHTLKSYLDSTEKEKQELSKKERYTLEGFFEKGNTMENAIDETFAISKLQSRSLAKLKHFASPDIFLEEFAEKAKEIGETTETYLSKIGLNPVKSDFSDIFANPGPIEAKIQKGQYNQELFLQNTLDRLKDIRLKMSHSYQGEEGKEKEKVLGELIKNLESKLSPEEKEKQTEKSVDYLKSKRLESIEKETENKLATFYSGIDEERFGDKSLLPQIEGQVRTSDYVFGNTSPHQEKIKMEERFQKRAEFWSKKKTQLLDRRQEIIDEIGLAEYKKSGIEEKYFTKKLKDISGKQTEEEKSLLIGYADEREKQKKASNISTSIQAAYEFGKSLSKIGSSIVNIKRQY